MIDGIEFSKKAIEAAKYNVQKGNILNVNYYAGDTEKFLWRAAKQNDQYDLIIADPPRDGMFKSLVPLMKIKPKNIIYVSCDPTTLSRDLGSLCKRDYKVKRFVALDFFPNTYHIESFVILERVIR
jgi:23S rRNA (uracil1939-C5)-methyltransferase